MRGPCRPGEGRLTLRQRKLKRVGAAALAVLLAAALSGCGYLFPPEEELLAPPLVEPEEVEYRTRVAENGSIAETLDVYASFSPGLTASLAFAGAGGRIAQVAVKSGQEVVAGQLLLELNSDELRRSIRQQEIEVELARLALDNAGRAPDGSVYDSTGIGKAELELKAAWDALSTATGGTVPWARDLQGYSDWYALEANRGALIEVSGENAANEARQAVKQKMLALDSERAAKAAWEAAQASPADAAARAAVIKAAELELKKQQNVLNDLKNDLINAQLVAPFSGMVTYLNPALEVGQNIDAYVTAIRVSDLSQVVLSYTGDAAHNFTVGMPVTVTIKSKPYAGIVAADPTTVPTSEGKMVSEVQFAVDDYTGERNMGDSAKVSAVLRSAEGVIVLPKSCVNSFFGRKFVNLLEDGVKVERDVETGIESATEVEIKKGLSVGEEVIIP